MPGGIGDEGGNDGADHTEEVIEIEAGRPPVIFQVLSEPVIEVDGDKGKESGGRRHKDKGDKPPDLPRLMHVRREGDQGERGHSAGLPRRYRGSHCQADILHEVADGKAVQICVPVYRAIS